MKMVAIKDMEIPKSCYECDIDMGECPIEKYQLWLIDYQDKRHKDCPLIEIEQSDDCVSRQSMLDAITEIDDNTNMDIYTNEVREIVNELPPVTPTQCIAVVRFNKDDLREICNERIEIEYTHGTCKDCKHNYKTSGNTFECSNGHRFALREPSTFYCADFEKRDNNKPKTYIDCQKCENFRNPDYSKCIKCEKRGNENEVD